MEVIFKIVQLIIQMVYSGDNAQVSQRKPVMKDANLVSQNSDLLVLKFHKIIIK